MKRPALLALAMAAAGLPLGCTTGAAGTATPENRPSFDRPTIPTGAPSAAADLDALAPCTLLTQEARTTLGLRAGQDRVNDGHRVCAFLADDKTFVVSLMVYGDEGLDGIVPETILKKLAKVGAHDAVTHHEGKSICVVSLAVGESASVDVGAAAAKPVKDATPDDLAHSCQVAERAAGLVEPRLP